MNNRIKRHLLALGLAAFWAAVGCETVPPIINSDNEPINYLDTDPEPSKDTDTSQDIDTEPVNPPGLRSCFSPDYQAQVTQGDDGANVGEPCARTADCLEPLLCIANACEAPGPREVYCNGADVLCPNKNQECIDFQCINLNARCKSRMDCPPGYDCVCSGFLCLNQVCQPADVECRSDEDCEPGMFCNLNRCVTDNQCTGSKDMRGSFNATSVLSLGPASDGAVGGVIDATQWIRDLLNGGGAFPGLSVIMSQLIGNFLMYNLQPYHIDLFLSLIDLTDILNDVQIQHRISLDSTCAEMYRGEMTFDQVQLTYKDQVFTESFANIPSIGALPPAEFGATVQCGRLAIDETHVDYIAAGTVRYATDVLTQVITGGRFKHLEGALTSAIDCVAISNYVSMAMANPLVGVIVTPACQLVVKQTVQKLTKALADKPSKTGWMKLKGEADVFGNGQMENGQWYGSSVGGEFGGDLLF